MPSSDIPDPLSPVLVSYGWVRSSYVACRNLRRHGIPVVVADSNRLGMCQASRYPNRKRRYISHYVDKEGFLSDMERICREERIGLLLPSHNETELLARARDRFPDGLSALLPDGESCGLLNNKSRAYDLAQSLGVPVPKRFAYNSPEELRSTLPEDAGGGFVVKLLTGNSAKGVFYARNAEEAVEQVRSLIDRYSLSPERYPQVEEFVRGESWGFSALYWEGGEVAVFSHRRIRERNPRGGPSTCREAAWNDALAEHARTLLRGLKWHGLIMLEFKVNPETGQIWFIEANPRLWGSLHLAIDSGVEFPYLAWLCAVRGPDAAREVLRATPFHPGRRARWLLGEGIVALRALRHGRFREAFHTFFDRGGDSMDDWDPRDPLALLGELAYYSTTLLRKRSMNPVEEGMIG